MEKKNSQLKMQPVFEEYILYTFERPQYIKENKIQSKRWQRYSITSNKISAISAGQKLFDSKKFDHIELILRQHNNREPDRLKKVFRWLRSGERIHISKPYYKPLFFLFISFLCAAFALAFAIIQA